MRPLNPGEGSLGLYADPNTGSVDESFKPGFGGRDGTVRFGLNEVARALCNSSTNSITLVERGGTYTLRRPLFLSRSPCGRRPFPFGAVNLISLTLALNSKWKTTPPSYRRPDDDLYLVRVIEWD